MPNVILTEEVAGALAGKQPVVAVEWAKEKRLDSSPGRLFQSRLEESVRARGAIPASIAVIQGRIHIGLTEVERERLAETRLVKLTEANLAHGIALGRPARRPPERA